MIETAEIKNFRGYSNAKLKDCRRINLVIGENGSGKTSLLEALFLAAGGSVEIALRLRALRGYDQGIAGNSDEIDQALWRDLFYKFNRSSQISVSLTGSTFRNRALTVKFNDLASSALQITKRRNADPEFVEIAPITFDWIGPKGRRSTVKPMLKNGKLELPNIQTLPEETYFFSSAHNYSAAETAKRFSELSKAFKTEKVVERFRQHFPSISDLSIEIVGGHPMVCAKYHDLSEKVPLNLVSSGMTKLAAILFSIASGNGGVLLIDEIENGIFFKRLPIMWESLLDFCHSTESQIFASTHSGECISAAAALAAKYPDDFSVIHTDGAGHLRQFMGDSFADAIKEQIEIR